LRPANKPVNLGGRLQYLAAYQQVLVQVLPPVEAFPLQLVVQVLEVL
jgi:hypothetical protein